MPKKRGRQSIPLKPNLHIYCEGEKTEPNYIRSYIETRFPGTRLSPVRSTRKNTPVQLVEEAIKAKKDRKNSPLDDMFWVVFDREAINKYPDALHAKARQNAKRNGIHIAFSNVCFEVWLLLHFEKTAKAYVSYNDLRKQSSLRKHIPGYEKGAKHAFTKEQIATARANAKKMNMQTKAGADPSWSEPFQWNPYTDVYTLLDAIDTFGTQEE